MKAWTKTFFSYLFSFFWEHEKKQLFFKCLQKKKQNTFHVLEVKKKKKTAAISIYLWCISEQQFALSVVQLSGLFAGAGSAVVRW